MFDVLASTELNLGFSSAFSEENSILGTHSTLQQRTARSAAVIGATPFPDHCRALMSHF